MNSLYGLLTYTSAPGGGSGGNTPPLIVAIDNNGDGDKTGKEVYDAFMSGRTVLIIPSDSNGHMHTLLESAWKDDEVLYGYKYAFTYLNIEYWGALYAETDLSYVSTYQPNS